MAFHLDTAVPYDRTAVRPALGDLPEAVRDAVAGELGGGRLTAGPPAGGGFTGGFAAVVTAENGASAFVKAAGPHQPTVLSSYEREAALHAVLPPEVPAPRLRFTARPGDWIVLGFEPVGGKAPALPMSAAELDTMLAAWARAAAALTPVPAAMRGLEGMRTLREDAPEEFHRFSAMRSGEIPMAPMHPVGVERLDELAALEQGIHPALEADAVCHGDLRPDNMIVAGDRAWICDWNWPSICAPWFDTAVFLVTAFGDGHDADSLFFAHPTADGVTAEQLDAVLAGAAGFFLDRAHQEEIPGLSPYLRRHQRWSGEAALAWLASRRGW